MMDQTKDIPSYEEAKSLILSTVKPIETVYVPIKKAQGNIISQDIVAGENLPPFNNAAMDGYAVKIKNILSATPEKPVLIDTLDDVPAGKLPTTRLRSGTTVKVMTGAPVPEGTDAVVPVELTEPTYGNRIKVVGTVDELANIRFVGEDVQKGEVILTAGTEVTFGNIGLLAALGFIEVPVFRRPRIGILASGDELIPIDKPLSPGKIRNSNTYMLMALAQACNADVVNLGVAKDSISDITNRIKKGDEADIIVCTGGASMGDRDFLKKAFAELNVQIKFTSVRQKPGKPLIFGTMDGKPVFGLPGNPVSTFVSFMEYVVPLIRKMLDYDKTDYHYFPAELQEDIQKKPGSTHFIRGIATLHPDGSYTVKTTGKQSSGLMTSIANANCIIHLDENSGSAAKGSKVRIHLMNLIQP
ncbi:MAG: molybdopterin molybdotransferase MoeA [Bacteroidetes bacterium]|nr:molybdopterin molybdotransferase MoeA [Bacteroidota bacterium]